MSIPSQLPQIVTAARSGALQALALQSGQMLEGTIIGAAPNGGTQVEIRGQMLNLVLPMPVKAGETLKLQVQGTGQQMRLAIQQAATPASPVPASPAPAAPPPQANIPLPPQQGSVAPQQALPLPQAVVQSPGQPPQPAAPTNVAPQPAQPPPVPMAQQATPNTAAPPAVAPQAATPPQAGTVLSQPGAPAQQPSLPLPAYPQAPAQTALPTPPAVAFTARAPAAPQVAQATPATTQPVAPIAPAGTASGNATPSGQPPAQAMPATPQAALAQMVHAAVPRQGAVTNLTTALAEIAGKVMLPEPVARAAQQVLAGRVAIDAPRFDGATLQAAVRGSGVFQEAALAKGQVPLPQADMKTALLTLRQTLTNWLGQQAPLAAVAHIAPPLKGLVPRARGGSDAPPIDSKAAPEEVGKQLLDRTESALARVRLHQHASLPDPLGRTADWSMDLPVVIGQQQTLLQLQIHRDQQSETEAASERGWQMRFAISLPGMGEVGAQVSLRAGTTGVMLWATEPEASAALEDEVNALRDSLANAGLRPGAVIVRHGEPPAPAAPPSGHFVDART